MSETNVISLKLLVDKNSKKVVFAEATKDFVDFLFGLLELPLGSILSLLIQHGVAGLCSLGRVYESAKNLDPSYLQPDQTKNFLQRPQRPSSSTKQTYLLDKFAYTGESSNSSSRPVGSPSPFGSPPSPFGSPSGKEKEVDGYVKAAVVYMVMDDLTVKPMSTISSITLFNTIGVKDMSIVQEKIVEINMKKALEMVMTSLESTTVLSDVFIGKEPPVDCNSESKRCH